MTNRTYILGIERVYLHNEQIVPYDGAYSSKAWSEVETTPFRLALNDVTGSVWTPAPAPQVPIYGGGPPFHIGRDLITMGYDTVTESIGIQIYAKAGNGNTALQNAADMLQLLRRELNVTSFKRPCYLFFWPEGLNDGRVVTFLVHHATVTESDSYLIEQNPDYVMLRATITMVRSMGFGTQAITITDSDTEMQNRPTGTPNNVQPFKNPILGDLAYEGQPILGLVSHSAVFDEIQRIYMATIYQREVSNASQAKSTSSSTDYTPLSATVGAIRGRPVLKARILARFHTFTLPAQVRISGRVQVGNETIYTLPTLSLPAGSSTFSTLLDFGGFTIPQLGRTFTTINVTFTLSSSSGGTVGATLDYMETLLYYEFMTIDDLTLTTGYTLRLQAGEFDEFDRWRPFTNPRIYEENSSTFQFRAERTFRGSFPRARPGINLYMAWLSGSSTRLTDHDTSATAQCSMSYLPLYHTLRGAS